MDYWTRWEWLGGLCKSSDESSMGRFRDDFAACSGPQRAGSDPDQRMAGSLGRVGTHDHVLRTVSMRARRCSGAASRTVLLMFAVGAVMAALTAPVQSATVHCRPFLKNGPCNGTDGNDTLYGTKKADYFYGKGGADRVYAKGGDDYVVGDSQTSADGGDKLYGGRGADQLQGFGGDDLLVGGRGNEFSTRPTTPRRIREWIRSRAAVGTTASTPKTVIGISSTVVQAMIWSISMRPSMSSKTVRSFILSSSVRDGRSDAEEIVRSVHH